MSSDGNDGRGRGELSPEERAAFKRRASELGRRLEAVKAEEARSAAPRSGPTGPSADLGLGFRMAIELVASVIVGGGIGWGLDRLLGTAPWLMILFLLFGIGAGFMGVFRTAKAMQARSEPLQKAARSVPDDDDES